MARDYTSCMRTSNMPRLQLQTAPRPRGGAASVGGVVPRGGL